MENHEAPSVATETTRNVRGAVSELTHKALRKRQNSLEDAKGSRPQLTEVVAMALSEWAASQG